MRRRKFGYCVLLAGVIGLSGCADYEPLEYTPPGEIPPGRGLFTGEKGAFYLYGDKKQIHGDKKPIPKDDPPPRGER